MPSSIHGEKFTETSYIALFVRFLRYGLLAWGGPIAQLALIEREMVYEQKLISSGYFNRLIAIYQAFPGPETHEICIHLGTQALGPFGGFLAGLGFMLPGFIFMMVLSWLYVLYGITTLVSHILLGIKPAVIAWILKGGIQLGKGILVHPALWMIAIIAFFAEIYDVNFIITFLVSGILYSALYTVDIVSFGKKLYAFIRAHTIIIGLIGIILTVLISFLILASPIPTSESIYHGSLLD